jgi:hypothetical protein
MARDSTGKARAPRRPYVRFTRWRRAHFFRVLGETGHAQMAAAAAGVSLGCIYRLRRLEPGFTEKMAAAAAAADERLAKGQPDDGDSTGTGQQAVVIRKGRGGRLRVVAAGPHWWTERHDALFLRHLRATGNVAASARAAGFTPKSAWNRRQRLPAFAWAMDEARDSADLALEFGLAGLALGRGGAEEAGGRLDGEQAKAKLGFRAGRKLGRHSPRRPPPPTIEAVTARIERLVRAVKAQRGT